MRWGFSMQLGDLFRTRIAIFGINQKRKLWNSFHTSTLYFVCSLGLHRNFIITITAFFCFGLGFGTEIYHEIEHEYVAAST